MNKEFKLSEKRQELFTKLCNSESDVAWIIQVIEQEIGKQDKEFVRLLKEELKNWGTIEKAMEGLSINQIIDKLAGFEEKK